MNVWIGLVCAGGGYAAAVFTWDAVKGFFISTETRIRVLEAKISDLRAKF